MSRHVHKRAHAASAQAPAPGWLRAMVSRDPHEKHRAATPLEMLFDLCFAVAVSFASARLDHGLVAGECGHAVLAYVLVFFAIWWAWMNFTWFASAYDVDDVPYRLKVLLQIAGVLVLAAGIPRAFDAQQFGGVTLGFTIMRAALVAHWLRAARDDPERRATALAYAVGLALCQLGWIGLLFLPASGWLLAWPLLVLAELAVPILAERRAPTRWHPRHIAERYGSFTLIVLGESMLSATVAIQAALSEGHFSLEMGTLIAGALVLLFSMWWLYFDEPVHDLLRSNRAAFLWGYGHLLIFAATAAVGAGLVVASAAALGEAHLTAAQAGLAVALPAALYVAAVWFLQVRPLKPGALTHAAFLLAPPAMLCAAASPQAVLSVGAIAAALVAIKLASKPARRA